MSKADEIMDSAETMVRQQGYNGFSFRDIADSVGIKSASVHYHFPTKEALGSALARRYTDRFLGLLPDSTDNSLPVLETFSAYITAFRSALVQDGKMCLCGMLGAESASLPASVTAEVERFFDLNCQWLDSLYRRLPPEHRILPSRTWALRTLAALEGAMIVARNMAAAGIFDQIAGSIADEIDV